MKIDISRLSKDNVITLSQKYAPQALDLEAPEVNFRGELGLCLSAQKRGDAVIIKGEIFLPLILSCSRCLAEYQRDLRKEVAFDYSVDKNNAVIDITEDIRSEVILNYDLNPLCKPDCKGLCQKCGEDLNKGKCGCGN